MLIEAAEIAACLSLISRTTVVDRLARLLGASVGRIVPRANRRPPP